MNCPKRFLKVFVRLKSGSGVQVSSRYRMRIAYGGVAFCRVRSKKKLSLSKNNSIERFKNNFTDRRSLRTPVFNSSH